MLVPVLEARDTSFQKVHSCIFLCLLGNVKCFNCVYWKLQRKKKYFGGGVLSPSHVNFCGANTQNTALPGTALMFLVVWYILSKFNLLEETKGHLIYKLCF